MSHLMLPRMDVRRRSLPNDRPRVAVAVREAGALLMVQQGRGRWRYRWDLPGGKVEPGETLLQAAARETLEETGCRVIVHGLCGRYDYRSPSGRSRQRVVWFGELIDGVLRRDGDEILEARWMSFERLRAMRDDQLRRPDLLRRILDDLQRGRRDDLAVFTEQIDRTMHAA